MDSSGVCLHTVSEAKITFVLLLYPPPHPPTPAPTPLFNDISYLRVVPIRNLLFIGAFFTLPPIHSAFFFCALYPRGYLWHASWFLHFSWQKVPVPLVKAAARPLN